MLILRRIDITMESNNNILDMGYGLELKLTAKSSLEAFYL